jgi:predicted permease
VAAVWPLARQGRQGYLGELVRNPLIISTVVGLGANALGLRFPEPLDITLHRIGVAALPIGLMAVGAGLRFGAVREAPALAAALLAIRHAALPLVGLAVVALLALPPAQRAIVIAFAAMPTASSAYVLAVRMGGHGPYVAALVSLSTLLGMVTLPAWLWLGLR